MVSPEIQEKLRQMAIQLDQQLKDKHQQYSENELTELAIYVPSKCTTYYNAPHSLDLMQLTQEFLDHKQKKVLLLLGDSGSGKTTFLERLVVTRNVQQIQELAIYISLPSIKDTDFILQEFLESYGFNEQDLLQLQKQVNFLFVFDGYDEITKCFNIYDENNLKDWTHSRFIIASRTQQFAKFQNGFDDYLLPHSAKKALRELVQELHIKPFSGEQRSEYIKKYAERSEWRAEKYEEQIKYFQIEELVQTPFALKLMLSCLPNLAIQVEEKTRQRIGINAVYEEFMKQWFQREIKKYEQGKDITLSDELKDQKIQVWIDFAIELATLMHEKSVTEVKYHINQPNSIAQSNNNEWKQIFSSEDEERRWALRACPLMVRNDTEGHHYSWRFLHKSFQEYFAAQVCTIQRAAKDKQQYDQINQEQFFDRLKKSLNCKIQDLSELSFAIDSLEENKIDCTQGIKEQDLFRIVQESKGNNTLQTAAANAMTILNAGGVSFSKMDLSGINIAGANLFGAIFEQTNLEGANLQDVNFSGAYLNAANLKNTNVANINFNELPIIGKQSEVGLNTFKFHPDGQTLLQAHQLQSDFIYRYNFKYGIQVGLISTMFKSSVQSISISSDGNRLAIYTKNNEIYFYNWNSLLSTWEEKQMIKIARQEDAAPKFFYITFFSFFHRNIQFSPDISKFAYGNDDGLIYVWNLDKSTGKWKEEYKLDSQTKHRIYTLSFFPDNVQLLAGCLSKIQIWNVVTKQLITTIVESQVENENVYYSVAQNDGKVIAVGIDDDIYLWKLDQSQNLWEPAGIMQGHTNGVCFLAISPDGSKLASCATGSDSTIRIWDLQCRKLIFVYSGQVNGAHLLEFSFDGKIVASTGFDSTIRFQKIENLFSLKKQSYGHNSAMYSIIFSPNGTQFASRSWDGTIIVWDAKTHQQKFKIQKERESISSGTSGRQPHQHFYKQEGSESDGTFLLYATDGSMFITGDKKSEIYLWDSQTGAKLKEIKLLPEQQKICRFSIVQDQCHFICMTENQLNQWECQISGDHNRCQNQAQIFRLDDSNKILKRVVYSQDENFIATLDEEGMLVVFDLQQYQIVAQFEIQITDEREKEEIVVYPQYQNSQPLRDNRHQAGGISCLNFTSDNQFIVSSGYDTTIRVWNIRKSDLECVLLGHQTEILCTNISPDMKYLASGQGSVMNHQGLIIIWDFVEKKAIQKINAHKDMVTGIIATPDWNVLISGSYDKQIKIWRKEVFEDGPKWLLHRIIGRYPTLSLEGALFENVVGLSQQNQQILANTGAKIVSEYNEEQREEILLQSIASEMVSVKGSESLQENSEIYFKMAGMYFSKINFEKSYLYCTKSIEADTQHYGAHILRGNVSICQKNYEQGVKDFTWAIEKDPTQVIAWNLRGSCQSQLGLRQEAIKDQTQAIALQPEQAGLYYDRGTSYLNEKQFNEALQDFNSAISLDKNVAQFYSNRASCYNSLNNFEEALKDSNEAVSKNKELPQAYVQRVIALKGLGRAEEEFINDLILFQILMQVQEQGNNIQRAQVLKLDLRLFKINRETIDLINSKIKNMVQLKILILKFGKNDFVDEFMKMINQIVQLQQLQVLKIKGLPRQQEIQIIYQMLLQRYQTLDSSESEEEKQKNEISEEQKAQIDALYNQAVQFLDQNNPLEAVTLLQAILRIHPLHIVTLQTLANVCVQLKQYEEALVYLQVAIQIQPNNEMIYIEAGVICQLYLSDLDRALQFYTLALQINENGTAVQNLASVFLLKKEFDTAELFLKKAIAINGTLETICEFSRFLLHQRQNYQGSLFCIEPLISNPEIQTAFDKKIFYLKEYSAIFDERLVQLMNNQEISITVGCLLHYLRIMNNYFLGNKNKLSDLVQEYELYVNEQDKDEVSIRLFKICKQFLTDQNALLTENQLNEPILRPSNIGVQQLLSQTENSELEEKKNEEPSKTTNESNHYQKSKELQKEVKIKGENEEKKENEAATGTEDNNCCSSCALYYNTIISQDLIKASQYMVQSNQSFERQTIDEELIAKQIRQKYIKQLQHLQNHPKIDVKILDEYQFNQNLLQHNIQYKLYSREELIDATKAFTYLDNGNTICVVFRQGYVGYRQIVKHEFRRIRQIIEGDFCMLRAYLEENLQLRDSLVDQCNEL